VGDDSGDADDSYHPYQRLAGDDQEASSGAPSPRGSSAAPAAGSIASIKSSMSAAAAAAALSVLDDEEEVRSDIYYNPGLGIRKFGRFGEGLDSAGFGVIR
jgi:hypothetical protein